MSYFFTGKFVFSGGCCGVPREAKALFHNDGTGGAFCLNEQDLYESLDSMRLLEDGFLSFLEAGVPEAVAFAQIQAIQLHLGLESRYFLCLPKENLISRYPKGFLEKRNIKGALLRSETSCLFNQTPEGPFEPGQG